MNPKLVKIHLPTTDQFSVAVDNTPDAPSEVARVVLTAPAACTPSGGCDDEPAQAHSWSRL
jgi:hypothetical protein